MYTLIIIFFKLNSIILEEVFSSIVQEMCAPNGYLSLVINIPSDVNWYKKDVKGSEEYDLQTFLESFFLIQESLDFANINDVTQCGENLRKLKPNIIIEIDGGIKDTNIKEVKKYVTTILNEMKDNQNITNYWLSELKYIPLPGVRNFINYKLNLFYY